MDRKYPENQQSLCGNGFLAFFRVLTMMAYEIFFSRTSTDISISYVPTYIKIT